MAVRLSEQEFSRLKKKKGDRAPRKPADRTYHEWELKGKRYVCGRCAMGIPIRFFPTWSRGFV